MTDSPNPRMWLVICILAVVIGELPMATLSAQDTHDLTTRLELGKQYRVRSQFQHQGQVLMRPEVLSEDVRRLPLEVNAVFDYRQRSLGETQAIRYFSKSKSDIKIDKVNKTLALDERNRLIVTKFKSKPIQLMQIASVNDTLLQSELELLKNPADPLTYAGLINKKSVQIGDQWTPDHGALAQFLAVDRVVESNVKLSIKKIDSGVATIHLVGHVNADIDDVIQLIDIRGTIHVDLQKKLVSAVRLELDIDRQAGQLAPGFVGKTKVNLRLAASQPIPDLSQAAISKLVKTKKVRNVLKWESPQFSLLYSPSWRLIVAEDEGAVLRYIENGDLLAQCNVVQLPSRPAAKPLPLEEFKREIAKLILAEKSARVVEANQSQSAHGLKVMQLKVHGEEEGVAINWLYYNVASTDGRQVTFVFTLEDEVADRVLPAAQKMVNGFKFQPVIKSAPVAKSASQKNKLPEPSTR